MICLVCGKNTYKNEFHRECAKLVFYVCIEEGCKNLTKGAGRCYSCSNKDNLNKRDVSGKNNPMYGRSVLDVWIEKYGKEKAHKMWEEKFCGENNPSARLGSPFKNKKHSERSKKLISENHADVSKRKNPMFGKKRPNHFKCYQHGGYYNDIFLRSSYEIRRAKWLDENNIIWKYEEKTYDLGNFTYTPDFFIYDENDNLIRIEEVKGYLDEASENKINIFKEKYINEAKIYKILFERDLEI